MKTEGVQPFDETFPEDFCIESAVRRMTEARSGQHDPRQQELFSAIRDSAVTALDVAVASGLGAVTIRVPDPLGKYYRYSLCRVLDQRFGYRSLRWTDNTTPSAGQWHPWTDTHKAAGAKYVKIVLEENEPE